MDESFFRGQSTMSDVDADVSWTGRNSGEAKRRIRSSRGPSMMLIHAGMLLKVFVPSDSATYR